jgi:A/G-specific adenine glycosylase
MSSKVLYALPSIQNMCRFRETIIGWFDSNGRDYPWRRTSDPFRILIAEMMLRRTKADQVKKVYSNLFARYPDVRSIAGAKQEDLEQILYSLGLKWRTPAFQLVAREIREKYDGKVPQMREQLTTLPGVGNYVAGAVLSIGYEKAEWIVDSNIVRLFKRYFGVRTSNEGRRDKHIVEMAKMYVSKGNSRKANLAILDFAALVCLPSNPDCKECPLVEWCKNAKAKKGQNNAK